MVGVNRLLGIVGAALAALVAEEARAAPNFVVILADDLGYAEVGAHHVGDVATPNIDAIARRIMSSSVDDDLKALVKAYQNVVIRSGGEGGGKATGNLMPPVLSMAKAVGAARPNMPQSLDNLTARVPEGTGAGAVYAVHCGRR